MLAMDALRWLTVKSLRGRTWAGLRVYDSPATPADLRIEEERAPFIAVYVDDAEAAFDHQSPNTASITADLLLEVAVASTVLVGPDSGDTDTSDTDVDRAPQLVPITRLAETDEGLESLIGWISMQCEQALIASDNPWAELWRVLTSPGRTGGDVRRGGAGQQGEPPAIRFASRITKWRVKLLDDPVWGAPIEGFWKDFVDMCEADSEMQTVGKIARAHMERVGDPIPDWEIEQMKGMWTLAGVSGIGIAPHWWPQSGEQPPAGTVGTSYHEFPASRVDTTQLYPGEDSRLPQEGLGEWQYHLGANGLTVGSPDLGTPTLTVNP